MIAKTAIRLWSKGSCSPGYRTHPAPGGPAVPLKPPKSNKGKQWTWSGSPPHPTRMHAYASLTAPQQAAWKATADLMNNDHTLATPLPYSGAIAYMLVNSWRRQLGMPYTDDAPTGTPSPAEIAGVIKSSPGPPGRMLAQLTR